MYNAGIKIMICQLPDAKSNFPKFCKVHALQKTKSKYATFIYTFSGNLCFNSQFKNCSQKAFSIKVIDSKKHTTST